MAGEKNRYWRKFQWQDKLFIPTENFGGKENFLLKEKTLVGRENCCKKKT